MMWSMLRLLLLGIIAISACSRNAINPYDLAKSIDSHNVDWASIWRKLGVTDPPDIPRCDPSSGLLCSAAAITVFNPSQVIVAVFGPEDVYLRFLEAGSGWRYAGNYIAIEKNFGQRYEISRRFDKSFLRVSTQGANGSNWDSEIEAWFDLSLPDFKPVFGFTAQGSENRMGLGISREVHAGVLGWGSDPDTIDLDVEIRYSSGYDIDLGFARYKATYERPAKKAEYSLREVRPFQSDSPAISNKAFEDLADIVDDGISNEQLLIYTQPRLKQIASGLNADAKDWLRSVLSVCKDTPEKRTLQALLQNKR
jgi:hypothetical protein